MAKSWAIQAAGYLALLALIWEWLGIGDRSGWQVLLSAVLGAMILFGAVWLFGMALAGPEPFPLRRMANVLPWVLAIAAAIGCAIELASYRSSVGVSIASHLTLWFRKPVKPQSMSALYVVLLWIAGTAAVLALLPFASRAAAPDTATARPLTQGRYWIGCAILGAIGFWLPGLLVAWVPRFQSFGSQTASMIVRFSFAYALAVAAWLEIAWLARRCRRPAGA